MPGAQEADERAAELAWRLPAELAPLARIALDYRWSWDPDGAELFRALDPHAWELHARNPVRQLADLTPHLAEMAASHGPTLERIARLQRVLEDDRRAPRRRSRASAALSVFVCAEFGVHPSLPIYSGGLGALAGDILKAASDLALPVIGVGPALPQGVLPAARRPDGAAARVLDADHARAAPDRSGARRRRRPAHALVPLLRPRGRVPRLAGGDRSCAALPPRRRARGERPARPVDHRPALRGEPAHAPRPVRAARPRDGARPSGTRDRARGAALQRGPSRPRRARAGGRGGGDRRGDRRCARSGARTLRVHDAHPRPGRERDLRDDVVPRGVRRPAAAPGHRSGQIPRPLPHPSGKRRVAGHDAARAASRAPRERGEHAPW